MSRLIYRLGETGLTEAEPDVAGFLEQDDTNIRRAAVWVLSRHWGMTRYHERLLDLACSDEDGGVRESALIGVGTLLRGTRHGKTTRLLASLLRDTSAYWYVRDAACLALLGIWLPETAAARETWRWWRPSRRPRWSWLRRRYAEDAEWATRVDWAMISRLERESS